MEQDDLCDAWRLRNPEIKRYTWVKTRPKISWSRIDFFLTSQNLMHHCKEATIISCIHSDHNLISIDVDTGLAPRGPGIWKFNDELLRDEVFVENATNLINGIKRSFEDMDAENLFELIKVEFANFSKEYSRKKKRDRRLIPNESIQTAVCNATKNPHSSTSIERRALT